MPYNVAFRYTRKTGGFHGVITWTGFPDKKAFDAWYTPEKRERQEIVEEGISVERAVELTYSTPLACRIAASVEESTDENGVLNESGCDAKIATALWAEKKARLGL
jgi:hypothetical protein